MKNILLKYKAGFITITVVFVLLLAFSVVRYMKAMEAVTEAAKEKLAQIPGNEINDAVVKIDTTNQQFVASYNLVYGQIAEDIQKINKNL